MRMSSQNPYLVLDGLSDLPEALIGRIGNEVLKLSEADMRQGLAQFSVNVTRYYHSVFDQRWIESEDNEASRLIFMWRDDVDDELEIFLNALDSACTNYVTYVRMHSYNTIRRHSYDKESNSAFKHARRAAVVENLERLKGVLDNIFQECQARERARYETSMRQHHPTENLHDLYTSSLFNNHIAYADNFKQILFNRIDHIMQGFV